MKKKYLAKKTMLSKLKGLANIVKKDKKVLDLSGIQTHLTDGLFGVMESSFNNRKKDGNNSNFSQKDVDSIVKEYAKRNMILAASTSIVPGPFGVLGSVPELLLNFGNQMNMIYDLSCAYNKEDFINKDVLLDIPFAAFGGNTGLADIQNGQLDLTDSPSEILRAKAQELGKSLIEKTLKKSVVQFVPIGGVVLMGTWAKMTTYKVAEASKKFLDSQDNYVEHFKPEETEAIKIALQVEKIKGLCNLIEANNDINEMQVQMILPIIDNTDLSEDQKEFYKLEALKDGSNFSIDSQLLRDYEEDENLILELVILAKRSGHIDEHEKEYIYKLGQDMGVAKSFIDELF